MIKLIILDVDGTLTDGKITYDEHNNEHKNFCVKDGLGIVTWIKKMNKKVAIITGRKSKLTKKRAKELGVQFIYQNAHNKFKIIKKICKKNNIKLNEVAAIGDDLNDLKMLKKVGCSFAPYDASKFILDIVDNICDKNGGSGAVREMIEIICENDNLTKEFISAWE